MDRREYQEKLADSLRERCELFDAAIPPTSHSVLDVGCNIGDVSAHSARRGRFVIGVDSSSKLIDKARARHTGEPNCGFVLMDVGPDDIDRLPVFDVVLMLSVHHHWLMRHGPEDAGAMLRSMALRTGEVMIFEGASRRIRYGDFPPDFVDNDEGTVTHYLESYLGQYVGDVFSRIEPLGKTRCVGEREPYRWSYALYR